MSSTCGQMVLMEPAYLFAYSMVGLHALVFYCSILGLFLNDFTFEVMGKKYMLSLLSAILFFFFFFFFAIVLKIEKLQVISGCSEQKYFHFGRQTI